MSIESRNIEILEKHNCCAELINLPCSSEFIINFRLQKLHVRTFFPSSYPSTNIIGVVLYIHGYTAHINRPMYPMFASELNNSNYALVTMDLHGHGYSDYHNESQKILIESYQDLLEDVWLLLCGLYSINSNEKISLAHRGLQCPFWLMGQSMGGAIAIALGHQLSKFNRENKLLLEPLLAISKNLYGLKDADADSIARCFQGCFLLCPGIKVGKPSDWILFLMNYLIVPWFPTSTLPYIDTTSNTWTNSSMIKYVQNDGYPQNIKGLGYSGGVRFKTGQSLLALFDYVSSNLHEVDFPFYVLHDPQDKVTKFEGSEELFRVSQTKQSDKKLILMNEQKHDLMHNCTTLILEHLLEFLKKFKM